MTSSKEGHNRSIAPIHSYRRPCTNAAMRTPATASSLHTPGPQPPPARHLQCVITTGDPCMLQVSTQAYDVAPCKVRVINSKEPIAIGCVTSCCQALTRQGCLCTKRTKQSTTPVKDTKYPCNLQLQMGVERCIVHITGNSCATHTQQERLVQLLPPCNEHSAG